MRAQVKKYAPNCQINFVTHLSLFLFSEYF